MTRVFESPGELNAAVGQAIGPGEWLTVTQKMIDDFAEATGDKQWIHVDVERAGREAPGGKTIAHGYLTLALLGVLQPPLYTVKASRILNYGVDKLRFLNAVPAGSRVRLVTSIKSVEEASGGLRATAELTIEIEGEKRPALVADIIFLYFA
jgi:acyl dehydratase